MPVVPLASALIAKIVPLWQPRIPGRRPALGFKARRKAKRIIDCEIDARCPRRCAGSGVLSNALLAEAAPADLE
jgi:hypothetical protein